MKVEERWGSASFTHTLAEIGWMASLPVLLYLNERATGDAARDWLSAWARRYFVGTDLTVVEARSPVSMARMISPLAGC